MPQSQPLLIELAAPVPKSELGSLGAAFPNEIVAVAHNCFASKLRSKLKGTGVDSARAMGDQARHVEEAGNLYPLPYALDLRREVD